MITVKVTGLDRVLVRVNAIPAKLRASLLNAVNRGNAILLADVKEKLSGPVLKARSGRLRRSINARVTQTQTSITGSVGTNVIYAAAHEYGFSGVVTVREHLRRITQAFGRSIAPRDITVRSHAANMRLPERSYLRSALAEQAGTLRALLNDAIQQAIA